MNLLATRASLALGLSKGGIPTKAARCMAGRMVQIYSVAELTDPNFGKDDPTVQPQLLQLASACG